MAVIHSSISRVKPGRLEDVLSMTLECLKVQERLNVTTGRLLTAALAGEASGLSVFSTEFEDIDEYARYAEVAGQDQEMQSLFGRAQAADSPVVIEQQSLATEVPLGRTPRSGRGSVVEVHVSRPTPGQLEAALAMARRVCDFVEANGALNARLFQLGYSGAGSGSLMSSWEFNDIKAWAKVTRAWETEPEGQTIAASLTNANPATTLVFSGLYSEIPL